MLREPRVPGGTGPEPPAPPDRPGSGARAAPDPQELEWVRRARAGDLDAFNRIVERYQSLAYHVAARMVGDAAAEDVTQEAFFAAYRAMGTFRGGSLRAWVLSIVVNRARDVLRTPHRRMSGSLDALIEQGTQEARLASPDPLPEAQALQAETVRAVRAAVALLPADQRLMVTLVDLQQLDYEEAARAAGVALGTVKSRLSRGRERLRELLTEAGELPGGPPRQEG